ncbi:MAG: electron transfer flavoprotein subunit alpha/FixB family protein [Chromatiales bacterium]|jgi:electron transfer flavoprotein alpha subunit|nr:MAG: electron transfer flavoprotein subunit alpha/FixB family protein [Chromatiales bacterium]
MSRVLVIAEHDGEHLNQSTARCVACAVAIEPGGTDIVILSRNPGAIAAQAAALAGVTGVLTVTNPANGPALAVVLAPQIASLARDYDVVLAPSTTYGKDLLPRVAALLGVPQLSDIMTVTGPRTFQRPIYAGNALVTIEVPDGVKVVATVRGASFKPVGGGNAAPIRAVELPATLPAHTRFVELRTGKTDRPDLQTARVVVSGGRGVGSADNFALLYKFADRLGAAVGASRAAVDAGFVPNDMQVGQTGKIIAPELYMAFGISGAIQHLTGIKDAGTIVAVNKDGEAPIFEIADIGLVGDLFQVIPEIEKLLR